MIVLDASVAIKWYFPEKGSDAAIDLLKSSGNDFVAPDIFVVEVAAALVRKANMEKAKRDDTLILLDDFLGLVFDQVVQTRTLSVGSARQASRLAIDLGHPLKDCVYLALAMDLNCPLITSDIKFAAKAHGVWHAVQVLGEVAG